jgi:hypothetical protein
MTVPPLFGWEGIITVVAIVVAVGVFYLLVLACRTSSDSRSEWQAFLDARSSRHEGPATDPGDTSGERVRPEPAAQP